jgi:hypothetical protein
MTPKALRQFLLAELHTFPTRNQRLNERAVTIVIETLARRCSIDRHWQPVERPIDYTKTV